MTVRQLIRELQRVSDTVRNGGNVEVAIMVTGKSITHARCIDKVDCVADEDLEPVIVLYPG